MAGLLRSCCNLLYLCWHRLRDSSVRPHVKTLAILLPYMHTQNSSQPELSTLSTIRWSFDFLGTSFLSGKSRSHIAEITKSSISVTLKFRRRCKLRMKQSRNIEIFELVNSAVQRSSSLRPRSNSALAQSKNSKEMRLLLEGRFFPTMGRSNRRTLLKVALYGPRLGYDFGSANLCSP